MNLFENVRTNVKPRAVMEQAGIHFNHANMCCCPFHSDKNPSMKVKPDDDRYFCFGCGVKGDAIDFVSNYYGLSLRDAAMKIANDFGMQVGITEHYQAKQKPRKMSEREMLLAERDAISQFLTLYLVALLDWKAKHAPKTPEEEWHPLFVEALQRTDQTRYLIDLLEESVDSDVKSIVHFMRREMTKINERLQKLDTEGTA